MLIHCIFFSLCCVLKTVLACRISLFVSNGQPCLESRHQVSLWQYCMFTLLIYKLLGTGDSRFYLVQIKQKILLASKILTEHLICAVSGSSTFCCSKDIYLDLQSKWTFLLFSAFIYFCSHLCCSCDFPKLTLLDTYLR